MKATVHFVTLTDQQRRLLDFGGWDTEIGAAYLDAKDGKITEANRSLYKATVVVNVNNAEEAWTLLQNFETKWSARTDYDKIPTILAANFRSMDVGDVIQWEDGRTEICARVGFEPVAVF